MKKSAILAMCLSLGFSGQVFAQTLGVEQYIVDVPKQFYVSYQG